MDPPVSLIGLAGTVVGIVHMISSSIDAVTDLQEKYGETDLKIRLLLIQLRSLQAALELIADWAKTNKAKTRDHPRKLLLDCRESVDGSSILASLLAEQVESLEYDDSVGSRADPAIRKQELSLSWDEHTTQSFLTQITAQTNSLNVILGAFTCRTLEQRQQAIQRNEYRHTIDGAQQGIGLLQRAVGNSPNRATSSVIGQNNYNNDDTPNSSAEEKDTSRPISVNDDTPTAAGAAAFPISSRTSRGMMEPLRLDVPASDPYEYPRDDDHLLDWSASWTEPTTAMPSPPAPLSMTDPFTIHAQSAKHHSQDDFSATSSSVDPFPVLNDESRPNGPGAPYSDEEFRNILTAHKVLQNRVLSKYNISGLQDALSHESELRGEPLETLREAILNTHPLWASQDTSELPEDARQSLKKQGSSGHLPTSPLRKKFPRLGRSSSSANLLEEEMPDIKAWSQRSWTALEKKGEITYQDYINFSSASRMSPTPPRLLILGGQASGKTTLMKSINKVVGREFDLDTKYQYNEVLRINAWSAVNAFCSGLDHTNINFSGEKTRVKLWELRRQISNASVSIVNESFGRLVDDVFSDSAAQKYWDENLAAHAPEEAKFCLRNILSICNPEYVPTDRDVMRAYVPTSGLWKYQVTFNERELIIFDVGGGKSERRKWNQVSDQANISIFCVSARELLAHHSVATKGVDDSPESLELFGKVCNSSAHKNQPFIVVFTHSNTPTSTSNESQLLKSRPRGSAGFRWSTTDDVLLYYGQRFQKTRKAAEKNKLSAPVYVLHTDINEDLQMPGLQILQKCYDILDDKVIHQSPQLIAGEKSGGAKAVHKVTSMPMVDKTMARS